MVHDPGRWDDESTSYVLYLYLWPFWMFRDVNCGSMLEQAAAIRHNRERRVYLPSYIVKWALIFLMLLSGITAFEMLGHLGMEWQTFCSLMAGATGVGASMAFVVMVQIGVVYLLLGI